VIEIHQEERGINGKIALKNKGYFGSVVTKDDTEWESGQFGSDMIIYD